jgi:hypothetical protein
MCVLVELCMMYRYVSIFISICVSILYLYGGWDVIYKQDILFFIFYFLFMYYGVIIRYVSG